MSVCVCVCVGGVYFLEQNGNGTEVAVVAYLDCIHELISVILIVFIENTLYYPAPQHISFLAIIVRVHALAAGQTGACMRLYSFAVHISFSHACLH